jgi:hypothetical protein
MGRRDPTTHREAQMTATTTAAATTALPALGRRDLLPHNCPTESLRALAFLYFGDEDSLQLIVRELEDRGIDPFA